MNTNILNQFTARSAAVLAGTALFLGAFAIRQYTYHRLGDLGFGGQVNAVCDVHNDGEIYAFFGGKVITAEGTFRGCKWSTADLSTPILLPAIGEGASDVSALIRLSATGRTETVGNNETLLLGKRPVLWREAVTAGEQLVLLPGLGGEGSCSGIVENTLPLHQNVRAFMCGWSKMPNGTMKAVLWVEAGNGNIQVLSLGTLGGPNSTARGIGIFAGRNGSQNFIGVSGAAQDSNGTWIPCRWEITENGNGWNITPIPLILDLQGQMAGECIGMSENGSSRMVGMNIQFFNGTTQGFLQDFIDGDLIKVDPPGPPALAFEKIMLEDLAATRMGSLSVGSAETGAGNRFGFVNHIWRGLYEVEQNTYFANELCLPEADDQVLALNGLDPVGNFNWMAGSAWATFPNNIVPCALEATNRHLTDYVTRTIGGGSSEEIVEQTVWNDDNKWLPLLGNRKQNGIAELEFEYCNLGDTATHEVGHWVGIIRCLGQNASATATLFAQRVSDGQWLPVGTALCENQTIDVKFTFSLTDYVNPAERMLRVRLRFTPNNPTTRVFLVNQAVLDQP